MSRGIPVVGFAKYCNVLPGRDSLSPLVGLGSRAYGLGFSGLGFRGLELRV